MQAVTEVQTLAIHIPPFSPQDSLELAADTLHRPEYRSVLSVPVVDGDQPVGMISRYQLNNILLKKFARDLYGKRPLLDFMSRDFLTVDVSTPLSQAAQYISQHMQLPLSEDFVITAQGRYLGVGAVLNLLGAMERQVAQGAAELTRAYRELKSSQAQLVQSEKMASLGQMVAGVAHEINTPLGYVKNNVEMVREFLAQARSLVAAHQELVDAVLDPEAGELALAEKLAAIDELKSQVDPELLFDDMDTVFSDTVFGLDQIAELVMGLKNFSRLDQAMTDNVSLNDCVQSALLIAKNALKHKVQVIQQLGELPKIACAPSQINQVLLNLLTNAAQAIEGEGKILIKTWAEAGAVHLSVQDSGRGISPENLKKIFDPFFTTKPVGEGTGLGLSISFQIIEQHGGRIRVASELGRGTRFVISLPRQAAAMQALAS